MHIGERLDSLPTDLILEILSRLPAKSVLRFRSVSKLWGSLLLRPHFTDMFSTRSSAHPRLLLAIAQDDEVLLYSSPHPQNSSSVDFIMKLSGVGYSSDFCSYASGLILEEDGVHMICNPSTRQYAMLPRVRASGCASNFVGFDPIDKVFKVLSMVGDGSDDSDDSDDDDDDDGHKILTLGSGTMEWRKIECHLKHVPSSQGICIDGVLYYIAEIDVTYYVIVCFDVRTETFTFLEDKCICYCSATLVNHNGKLGLISWECDENCLECDDDADAVKLCVCVLEDVKKQEWSKSLYSLKVKRSIGFSLFVAGLTATGEIVLSSDSTSCEHFCVLYFDPKRNTLEKFKLQGLEKNGRVIAFVDHVEDLKFNIKTRHECKVTSTSTPSITVPKPDYFLYFPKLDKLFHLIRAVFSL